MSFLSLFAGKMLGDGYMNRSHKAPRFCFIHALSDKAYADYCFGVFSKHISYGTACKHMDGIFDKRTGETYYRVYYQSRTAPILHDLYNIWYRYGHKVIPSEWLVNNLNQEGLSLWYQDDGCLKKDGRRIILSTESFSKEEIDYLRWILKYKFNVNVNIDSQNRLDISSRREVRKFQALMEPYIHASMERKSIRENWEGWKVDWLKYKQHQSGTYRTSIYLPYELYSVVCGEGYSQMLNVLLDKWMDKQWFNNIIDPCKRYKWLLSYENVDMGRYLITPRFRIDIKGRLDLLSKATGFDRSELVSIALMDNY